MENSSLKFWKIFALLLVVLNCSLLAFLFSKPSYRAPQPAEHGPARFIIKELKFTKEQEASFETLKTVHHDSMMVLKREGKQLREEFFLGLQSDRTLTEQDSLLKNILANQESIETITYLHFADVKKLCTPEQQVTFNKIITEIIERLKPRHERPHEAR